jgi:hypothetical protein
MAPGVKKSIKKERAIPNAAVAALVADQKDAARVVIEVCICLYLCYSIAFVLISSCVCVALQ